MFRFNPFGNAECQNKINPLLQIYVLLLLLETVWILPKTISLSSLYYPFTNYSKAILNVLIQQSSFVSIHGHLKVKIYLC